MPQYLSAKEFRERMPNIPEDLKHEWVSLIYTDDDRYDASVLERLILLLDNPAVRIPSRERSRKTLSQLKALADTINQLERNTDFLLSEVLNGTEGTNSHEKPLSQRSTHH